MIDFIFLTIPILIVWAWTITLGFSGRHCEGGIIVVRQIPVLARMKRHASTHALLATVTAALAVLGLASLWWLVVTAISFVTIVAIPQKYVVTTRGIRTGRGAFRRWTEFAGVHRSTAGVTLQTIGRHPNVPIWLARDRGDDEFVHLLRTLVRDSYKGKVTPLPVMQTGERASSDPPDLGAIAAFQQPHTTP